MGGPALYAPVVQGGGGGLVSTPVPCHCQKRNLWWLIDVYWRRFCRILIHQITSLYRWHCTEFRKYSTFVPNCQESTYLAQARVFVDVIGIFGMKILSGTRGGGQIFQFWSFVPRRKESRGWFCEHCSRFNWRFKSMFIYRVPVRPGKSWNLRKKIFQAWKVMGNDCGHGNWWNSTNRSWDFFFNWRMLIVLGI